MVTGLIFVICVLAFRRGIMGEIIAAGAAPCRAAPPSIEGVTPHALAAFISISRCWRFYRRSGFAYPVILQAAPTHGCPLRLSGPTALPNRSVPAPRSAAVQLLVVQQRIHWVKVPAGAAGPPVVPGSAPLRGLSTTTARARTPLTAPQTPAPAARCPPRSTHPQRSAVSPPQSEGRARCRRRFMPIQSHPWASGCSSASLHSWSIQARPVSGVTAMRLLPTCKAPLTASWGWL